MNLMAMTTSSMHDIPWYMCAEDGLDIWQELPIVIVGYDDGDGDPPVKGADNLIIASLWLNSRVPRIRLWVVPNSLLERFAVMMQDPFPTLTDLDLWLPDDTPFHL